MYAFTKPSNTRAMRKNKQKASRRKREKEYWDAWRQEWHLRRERLELTFRIWSQKEKHLLHEYPQHDQCRWSDVVKKTRATIPSWMISWNIYQLKKVMRCLSLKDISWDFYNELLVRDQLAYEKKYQEQKNAEKEAKKYHDYIEWEISQTRRKRK